MNGCIYKAEDGLCLKLTDDKVTSYCVESPCEFETPSNADRIRNMTDEELVELFDEKIWDLPWCDSDAPIDPETKKCLIWDCKKCVLKWLKQDV